MNAEPLLYWMYERQKIYNEKEAGCAWPWTGDTILQKYRFCNVFREQDKVTKFIRQWSNSENEQAIQIVALAIARFFNLPSTLELIDPWDMDFDKIKKVLTLREKAGHKIFSPAYIISPCGSTKPKIERVMDDYILPLAMDVMGGHFKLDQSSLENSWKELRKYQGFGPFMAYEVITDLRHTPWLRNAEDIYLWANAGPGAIRGLNRLADRPLNCKLKPSVYNSEMRWLLNIAVDQLSLLDPIFRKLEMRDIEHSLCETDKMLRVLNGEGTPKETYKP